MIKRTLAALALAAALTSGAAAQTPSQSGCVYITTKDVLTAAQWNYCFQIKQDALGYTPVNRAGDTMQGKLTTIAPTVNGAGFNLPQGSSPASPINGDLWMTTSGVFARVNGVTVGPLGGGGASGVSSVTGTAGQITTSPTTGSVVVSLPSVITATLTFNTGTINFAGTTQLNGTAFGTLATGNAAAPPALGTGSPNSGAFTTLSATGAVSGAGFTALFASPPAIGGTAAAAGNFTTLGATGTATFGGQITAASLASWGGTGGSLCVTAGGAVQFQNGGNCFGGSGGGSVTSVSLASAGSTATITGTNPITGSGTINVEVNLAHPNTWTGLQIYALNDLAIKGSSTGTTTLTSANAGVSNFIVTFPAATDTVALLAAAQTLTNKIIGGSQISANSLALASIVNLGANGILGNATGGGAVSALTAGAVSGIVNETIQAGPEFGVLCNGSTNDATAIANAIAAAAASINRKRIVMPAGTCPIGSSITIDSNNVAFEGQGHVATILQPTFTTGDVFIIGHSSTAAPVQGVTIRGFGIVPAATHTSGALIRKYASSQVRIIDVATFAGFVGLALDGTGGTSSNGDYNTYVEDSFFETNSSAGILIGSAACNPSTPVNFPQNVWLRDVDVSGNGTNSATGGVVLKCGNGINTLRVQGVNNSIGFLATPGTGQYIGDIFSNGDQWDTSTSHGVFLNPQGGIVANAFFTGLWSASNVGAGIDIDYSSGNVRFVTFSHCVVVNNQATGIFLNQGSYLSFTGCNASLNTQSGTSTFTGGLTIGNATSHVTITGGRYGPGLEFGNGVTGPNLQNWGILSTSTFGSTISVVGVDSTGNVQTSGNCGSGCSVPSVSQAGNL